MQESIACPQQIQNLRVRNENDVIKDQTIDTLDIKHMATSENQSVFIDSNNKIYVSGKKIYAEFTEMK